jgi:excisionase family DNA binding protein
MDMMTNPPEQPRLLTRQQVADYLHVSETHLDWLIRHNGLPVIKVGRRALRVRADDLAQWLDAKSVGAPAR